MCGCVCVGGCVGMCVRVCVHACVCVIGTRCCYILFHPQFPNNQITPKKNIPKPILGDTGIHVYDTGLLELPVKAVAAKFCRFSVEDSCQRTFYSHDLNTEHLVYMCAE